MISEGSRHQLVSRAARQASPDEVDPQEDRPASLRKASQHRQEEVPRAFNRRLDSSRRRGRAEGFLPVLADDRGLLGRATSWMLCSSTQQYTATLT